MACLLELYPGGRAAAGGGAPVTVAAQSALDWTLGADDGEALTTFGTYPLTIGDAEWVGDSGLTFTAAFDAGGLDVDLANFTSYLALIVSAPLRIGAAAIRWMVDVVVYDVLIDAIDLGVTGDSVDVCITPSGTALEVQTAIRVQLLRVTGGTITAQTRVRGASTWGSSPDQLTGLTMGSIMLRIVEYGGRITLLAASGAAGSLSMVAAPTADDMVGAGDLTAGGVLTQSTRSVDVRSDTDNDLPTDHLSGERRLALRHTRVGGSASSHSIATWVRARVTVLPLSQAV